ncbi:MAG: sigma-70 family RNA polymerase sigma factor, partial [Planctomycetes bacterium]|nr:sigma-70 family RNA polymerase sigma factor [Planctomycetota bacterium]
MLITLQGISDDHLLDDFIESNRHEPFAELVRRHGPMVWGVCRQTTRHLQDAEDAFQATFAVLARKASTIRRRRSISGWLYQVARRIALSTRTDPSHGRREFGRAVIELEERQPGDRGA